MLQGAHSAILLTFIKLPFVIKIFVSFIFDRPFYTGHPASSEQLENFRKEIFNKQEVDIKMNTMQNRMNDMEGLVHHTNMESSMGKKMKRSVSTRGIWKVLSMVFYLSNRFTKPIKVGIILKSHLFSMLWHKFHEDIIIQTRIL